MDILPLWAWVLFYALVFVMLIADLKMFGKKGEHEVSIKEALKMTGVWIGVSLIFCAGIYLFYPVDASAGADILSVRHEKAMEFLAGYLIEKSLSMDNLFVFLMLFSFFGVERKYQHEVLFWGIFGALVLRSIFIFAGAAMVMRFEWVLGLFGLFLLYTGAKMFTHDDEQQSDPSQNIIVRLFKKFFPVTDQMHDDKFFIREQIKVKSGKMATATKATPLFIALLVIETTDVAFAVDSIPAVFSVSRDPFIVLTSNIFAILGLRALYFALAAVAKYFTYLKYGLGIILIFVGVKMLLAMNEYINMGAAWLGYDLHMPHIEIPTVWSLAFIFGVLLLSMLLSYAVTKKARK
ncbi:MAG: TerC family protein [Prevotella sp.]|nr:TerC family protein [Prevotella sp.]